MFELLHNAIEPCNSDYYSRAIHRAKSVCQKPDMQFRLQHYRQKSGMTQTQVAQRIGISQGLYNQLESGKRRMNETYLSSLADLYGVSPAQLIVDQVRDDPLFLELDEAYRLLSLAERKTLVNSAKGIASGRERT